MVVRTRFISRSALLGAFRAAAAVALLAVLCLLASAWRADGAEAGVAHGLADFQLDNPALDSTAKEALVREVGGDLATAWVRTSVLWPALEPARGQYDTDALDSLDHLVDALRARGVRVLVSLGDTPRWASDSSYWDDPPNGLAKGYRGFYPMKDAALADFEATAAFLAGRYAGRVQAYQCGNEPNLWPYLFPQRTAGDADFAARTYLRMLKAFSRGIRRCDRAALVVTGGTAPIGLDDKYRTSPQRFARFLKANGAAAYFDVYAHHPYTPGGSVNAAPNKPPNDPSTTVTLYNLKTLLRLFPGKPFFLTEYGYSTAPGLSFGGFAVDQVRQATYLRKAYAYAGRYRQVKALFWLLVRDLRPATAPDMGVYTGLRTSDGNRKLSWFAFAGGNRITVTAPRAVKRGGWVRVAGVLTNRAVGPVKGRRLVLESRRASGGRWSTLKSGVTKAGGRYSFWTRASTSRAYRVVWRGVTTSPKRVVRVR